MARSHGSFEFFSATLAGYKGGLSRSPAKVKAARRNGRKGGRPTKDHTLLERLLNRRHVSDATWKHLYHEVIKRHMLIGDTQVIEKFFQVAHFTHIPVRWPKRIPLHVRQAIRHLKAVVTIYAPAERA